MFCPEWGWLFCINNAILNVQTDEFATHWHRAAEDKDIENYIAEHTLLETDAGTLKLSENAVFQEPVGESIYALPL